MARRIQDRIDANPGRLLPRSDVVGADFHLPQWQATAQGAEDMAAERREAKRRKDRRLDMIRDGFFFKRKADTTNCDFGADG